jgi:hypothetical protein
MFDMSDGFFGVGCIGMARGREAGTARAYVAGWRANGTTEAPASLFRAGQFVTRKVASLRAVAVVMGSSLSL